MSTYEGVLGRPGVYDRTALDKKMEKEFGPHHGQSRGHHHGPHHGHHSVEGYASATSTMLSRNAVGHRSLAHDDPYNYASYSTGHAYH